MIVVLRADATETQISHIVEKAEKLGLKAHISRGVEKTIIGFIGPEDVLRVTPLEVFPGVESVMPIQRPYKLATRDFKPEATEFEMKHGVIVGGKKLAVMAGPCSVENREMLFKIVHGGIIGTKEGKGFKLF